MGNPRYEYTYHRGSTDGVLQIFSFRDMNSYYFDARETQALLHMLQDHQAEIENMAQKQAEAAQQPKRPKTRDERIDDLFQA